MSYSNLELRGGMIKFTGFPDELLCESARSCSGPLRGRGLISSSRRLPLLRPALKSVTPAWSCHFQGLTSREHNCWFVCTIL